MARTTSKGLYVWDNGLDNFNHTQLAANWDLIDSLLNTFANSAEVLASIPGGGNFPGRLVMLSTANGGFAAWTLIRYDGTNWRGVAGVELLPTVPVTGNFAGRIVILSSSDGGFNAYDVIRYDGTQWGIVGGFQNVNNGNGALNIQGLMTPKDVYITTAARGLVLKDRTTTTTYRLYVDNAQIFIEAVT